MLFQLFRERSKTSSCDRRKSKDTTPIASGNRVEDRLAAKSAQLDKLYDISHQQTCRIDETLDGIRETTRELNTQLARMK